MDRILEFYIEKGNIRIIDFLRKKGFSRRVLIGMKSDSAAIRRNNQPAFGHSLLYDGDRLQIRVQEIQETEHIPPREMPLDILYEDEDILVLNKAADLPVHPSHGNHGNTLANGLAFYYASRGEPFVCRCINRLDRDTTGALIFGKNALSAGMLSAQMKGREIKRTYLAITQGLLPPSGTIDAPIARKEGSVLEREVNLRHGERAVTHFTRLDTCQIEGMTYSLAELHLETGRTHQIRVHLKYLGCPLPGDFLYNPVFDRISRQALHSYQLEFVHPITGQPMLFTAPVPPDFAAAWDPDR